MQNRHRDKNAWTPRGVVGVGMNWEAGIAVYTVLCVKPVSTAQGLYSVLRNDKGGI